MAKIPLYVSNAQLATGSVVSFPGGSPVGGALEQAGETLNAGFQRIAERARQRQEELDQFKLKMAVQELELDADGVLENAKLEMPADAAGFHDAVVGQIDPATGTVLKPGLIEASFKKTRAALPPSMQARFDAMTPAIRKKYSSQAAQIQWAGRQNYFLTATERSLGILSDKIAATAADDQTSFAALKDEGLQIIAATGLSPVQKQELSAAWKQRAAETAWAAQAQRDPAGAKAALGLGGKPQQTYRDIPMERRSELAAHAELQAQLQQKEAQQAAITEVMKREAKITDRIKAGEAVSVEEIKADPVIDRRGKGDLLRLREEELKVRDAAAKVTKKISEGAFLDATDTEVRQGLDRNFQDAGGSEALIKGDAKALDHTLYTWRKSAVIADDAKQALLHMTRAKDDATLLRGYATLGQMQRDNPAGFDAAFHDEAQWVQLYGFWSRYLPEGEVARKMREHLDPDWILNRKPLLEAGEALAQGYGSDSVKGIYGKSGSAPFYGKWGPTAEAGDLNAMTADFRKLYAYYYAATGDRDAAYLNAREALKRVWAPSAVNNGAVSRYPFENYYEAREQDDPDWAKREIDAKLKDLGYTLEVKAPQAARIHQRMTQKDNIYRYRLAPIANTEIDIANGRRPRYNIVVNNLETGQSELVHNKDRSVLIWPDRETLDRMEERWERKGRTSSSAKPGWGHKTLQFIGATGPIVPIRQ